MVVVEYAGTPAGIADPDSSTDGWIPTDDGAMVVNKPQGSPAGIPVNDTPATRRPSTSHITVPAGSTVMGNGVLVSKRTRGGHDHVALARD